MSFSPKFSHIVNRSVILYAVGSLSHVTTICFPLSVGWFTIITHLTQLTAYTWQSDTGKWHDIW